MFNAIAVMSEKDILAIHGVVSNELKAQIEQAYPHLFRQQFDFSSWDQYFMYTNFDLPFLIGKGLVDDEDQFKSLVVKTEYTAELDVSSSGYQVIRFFKK